MTVVKILVERAGTLYIASAHDDVGKVCEATDMDRRKALSKVKRATAQRLGNVDEWRVEDLG